MQGPRPTPLKISTDSHKIRKPPVITYTRSPRIIHTNPTDFMTVVQRLTGRCPPKLGHDVCNYANPLENKALVCSSDAVCVRPSGSSGYSHYTEGSQFPMENPNYCAADDHMAKEETICGLNTPEAYDNAPSEYHAGPSLQSPRFMELSPSMILSSPHDIFQDMPLFTPQSEDMFAHRNVVYTQSEAMFCQELSMSGNSAIMKSDL